ncbi:hypothetical protein BC830DRAFT_1104535 [Chytriomyces sp. MP71]|nr:hypothetical protein BC830DRAFT_1104535 [Chytriomyces sp. MP71]
MSNFTDGTVSSFPPPTSTVLSEFLIYGALAGLTIMTALISLLSVVIRLWTGGRDRALAYWVIHGIMLIFNVWAVVFSIYFTYTLVLGPNTCVTGYFVTNLSSHFFFFSFDLFLCFKTCTVARWNPKAQFILGLVIVNRVIWAIFDLIKSSGSFDPVAGCIYSQYPITGIGYNSADIICDALCTIISLGANWRILISNVSEIGGILLKENVLLAALMCAVNSVLIWVSSNVTDPYTVTVAFYVQNLIYCVCLNLELVWIEARKSAVQSAASAHNVSHPTANAVSHSSMTKPARSSETRKIVGGKA